MASFRTVSSVRRYPVHRVVAEKTGGCAIPLLAASATQRCMLRWARMGTVTLARSGTGVVAAVRARLACTASATDPAQGRARESACAQPAGRARSATSAAGASEATLSGTSGAMLSAETSRFSVAAPCLGWHSSCRAPATGSRGLPVPMKYCTGSEIEGYDHRHGDWARALCHWQWIIIIIPSQAGMMKVILRALTTLYRLRRLFKFMM
jgi:hypothetical protein